MRERLNQSFFLYILEYLFIKSILFLLNNLFLFFSFCLLDNNIEWVFLIVIDLELFFGIEEIVSYKLGNIGDKSQFRNLKKCDNDKYNDNHDSEKNSHSFGS